MEPVEAATLDIEDHSPHRPADEQNWMGVCDALRKAVGGDTFQRWFGAAKWVGEEDGVGMVSVPGEMHQLWIETNFLPELTIAVNGVFTSVREVRVVRDRENAATGASVVMPGPPSTVLAVVHGARWRRAGGPFPA